MSTRIRRGRRRRLAVMAAVLAALPTTATITTLAGTTGVAHAAPALTPEQAAIAQAESTGQPVTVDADATAYTDTVANPNGSFTWTSHPQPERARRNGAWVSPDATLHLNNDGTVSPAATVSGLTLSGGGTAPLAVMDDGTGHRMSLTLPMPLPTPTLSGATATYPAALPGVDLIVTATVDGGFSDVLVVHDAAAAANPMLANLHLATATTGLALTTDPATGAVTANDTGTGKAVFSAPPPLVWDSTAPTPAQQQALDQARQDPHVDASDVPPSASSPQRPGAAAHLHRIGLTTAPGAITLTTPTEALQGAVTYPAYLDPGWSTGPSQDAYVQSYHGDTVAYNPSDNLRTGFSDWTTNCGSPCWIPGITRTYLTYNNIDWLWTDTRGNKSIEEAHLQLYETDAACSGNYQLQVTETSLWGSNLDWNNQPGWTGSSDSITVNGVSGYQVPVANMMQDIETNHWTTISMIMQMNTETDHCAYRHWQLGPSLVVTYWSVPDPAQNLAQVNGGQTIPCNSTSPGTWIPAASNNQIGLHYTMSLVDEPSYLNGSTYVVTNGGTQVPYYDSTPSYSGGNYPVTRTISVADGSSYGWSVQVDNGHVWGPFAGPCFFRYDGVAPNAPTNFTSTAYPKYGPTTVTTGGSGTISWAAATDPAPNGVASGVAGYTCNLNGTGINSGGISLPCTSTPSVSVPLSALHWGLNTLRVQTKDNAGNPSTQVAQYDFYVQQSAFGTYNAGTAGDVTGDSNPDLVTIDAAGNVRVFSHPDAGGVAPAGGTTAQNYGGTVIIPASSGPRWPVPDSASAAGALITHGGSFIGNNADDLIIEQNGFLYVAQNINGNASAWAMQGPYSKPTCSGCSNYNSQDWGSVTQMIAVPTTPRGRPDLLTVELFNGVTQMWLYPPLPSQPLGFGTPRLISSDYPDWHLADAQLLGASPLPGLTGTTLIARTLAGASAGNIVLIPNITALANADLGPLATTIASGFTPATAPMVATTGRADPNGNWPLWATNASGYLTIYKATTTAGTTTWADQGAPNNLSDAGWAHYELALGSSYTPPNNTGVTNDNAISTSHFDTSNSAYSAQALANATFPNGETSYCPPTWSTTCSRVGPGYWLYNSTVTDQFIITPGPAGSPNNWSSNGQLLPAPIPGTSGPAHAIAFLGSATTPSNTGATGTATITYTNGDTQQITITMSDWTLDNNTFPVAAGNTIVATTAYRNNTSTGQKDLHNAYLFTTTDIPLQDNGAALPAGVQIASITLPNNNSIHIFSIAIS